MCTYINVWLYLLMYYNMFLVFILAGYIPRQSAKKIKKEKNKIYLLSISRIFSRFLNKEILVYNEIF